MYGINLIVMGRPSIIFASVVFSLVLLSSITISSYSDYLSPKKQLESGVLPEDVLCRENRTLVIRDNGDSACVTEKTAEKKGWGIVVAGNPADEVIAQELQLDEKISIPYDGKAMEPIQSTDGKQSQLARSQYIIKYNQMILQQNILKQEQDKQKDSQLQYSQNLPKPRFETELILDKIPSLGETVDFKIIKTPTKEFFEKWYETKDAIKKDTEYAHRVNNDAKRTLEFFLDPTFILHVDDLPENIESKYKENNRAIESVFTITFPIDAFDYVDSLSIPGSAEIITGTITPTKEGNYYFGLHETNGGGDSIGMHIDAIDSFILTWPYQLTSHYEGDSEKIKPTPRVKAIDFDELIASSEYSTYDEIDKAIEGGKLKHEYYTSSEMNWTKFKDSKRDILTYLPLSENAQHTTAIPEKITVEEITTITVDLKSPNNTDEFIVYDVYLGPGLDFKSTSYDMSVPQETNDPPKRFRNIFSDGTRTFTFEIVGLEPGVWMFKDKLNDQEFHRNTIIVE